MSDAAPVEIEVHLKGLYWPCPECRCTVGADRTPFARVTIRGDGDDMVITPHLTDCEAMR